METHMGRCASCGTWGMVAEVGEMTQSACGSCAGKLLGKFKDREARGLRLMTRSVREAMRRHPECLRQT